LIQKCGWFRYYSQTVVSPTIVGRRIIHFCVLRVKKFRKGTIRLLAFIIKPEPFYSIGQFYENCEQVSDDEIGKIMKRHGYKRLHYYI